MSLVRPTPCEACPYRCDVPSGVWAEHEYEKLREYDNPTPMQPMMVFACHANPDFLCNGWAIVHTSRGNEHDLLALRVWPPEGGIPKPVVPLFSSGDEAADHGLMDLYEPSAEAVAVQRKLVRKHPRLRGEEG